MKLPVLCLAVLSSTLAIPNGYYHQEYNYKTSSSSFKNNELQHKTDDQGYYKKDGDLEGHSKPRVDSNSEHSEYVNPNLRNGQYTSGYGGGSDLTSSGHMRAANDFSGYDSNMLAVDGLAHNDRIVGSRGYSSGYSAGYGSNSYAAGSNSYGAGSSSSSAANLRVITSRLQQDLENDLQEAIRANNMYAQARVDINQLESELRRNLTERLNNELMARYGQQMIRDGMSYSLDGGRLHSTANYQSQELADLKSQVENSLMNRLRTQYYSSSSSTSNQYYNNNQQGSYGYVTTPRSAYRPIYPSLPTTSRYPIDYNAHANYQTVKANYQTVNSNARYTPVQQPESITSIATKVQNEMDQQLNQLLDETKTKYFSSSSAYALTNTDVLLERLRNELRSNLTYLLDENIRRNYGTQQQRDGYMYSLGPNGQYSSEYNYALGDLENLKNQVERNLINKLNKDVEGYKSSWSSHQSYSSHSNYGNNYEYSSTPRYEYHSNPNYQVYSTPRSSIYSLYTTPYSHGAAYVKNGGSSGASYNYLGGSQQSGYETQSSGNMAQLQRNLQDQLSRQLQAAINQGQYSSYSTSGGSYSPSNYQTSLQELSNELNRNLTRNLQEYSASGSYAAYGNFDSTQMERLKTQLQASLMSQLREGLQQSFQSHSSYSSSGSSSNYRQVRGFRDEGQYRSALASTDVQSYRAKRSFSPSSYGHHQQSVQHFGGAGSYSGYGRRNLNNNQEEFGQAQLGQEQEQSDLVQEVQNPLEFGQQMEEVGQVELGQQLESSDLVQEVQNPLEFGQQVEEVGQVELGQQLENSDLVQEVQNPLEFGQQLEEVGQVELGQELENSDLVQEVQNPLEIGHQMEVGHIELGQQLENSDLVQEVQNPLEFGHQMEEVEQVQLGQELENSDLVQEVQNPLEFGQQVEEDNDYGKLQLSNQERGQQTDNSDLTYQVQEQQHPVEFGHQVEDEDTGYRKPPGQKIQHDGSLANGQLVEKDDTGYGELQVTQLVGQQTEDYQQVGLNQRPQELGQQDEEKDVTGHGKLQNANQKPLGHPTYESDSTQQVEGRQVPSGQHESVSTQQGEVSGCNIVTSVIYLEEVTKTPVTLKKPEELRIDSSDDWCNKYIDTSWMDSPWSLSKQLKQSIVSKISQNGGNKAQPESILRDVLQGIPEDMLLKCFQLHDMTDLKDQQILITGLKDYFQSLIKIEIETALKNDNHQSENENMNQQQKVDVTENLLEPQPLDTEHKLLNQNKIDYEDSSKWCDKYVDTSLMDAPWFLSRELKDNITKEVSQNGGHNADFANIFENILKGIPKDMLTKCFQVDMVEVKYQETVLAGLDEYFNSLVKRQIENAIKGNPEQDDHELEVQSMVDPEPEPLHSLRHTTINDQIAQSQEKGSPESKLLYQQVSPITEYLTLRTITLEKTDDQNVVQGQTEDEPFQKVAGPNEMQQNQVTFVTSSVVSTDSEKWCSQYVDLSLMDVPWGISRNLKETIIKKVSEGGRSGTTYDKILEEVPSGMLRKCFQIDTIAPNEQETVLAGIEDYFQSLIKREFENAIKGNKYHLSGKDLHDNSDNNLIRPSYPPLDKLTTQSRDIPLPYDQTSNLDQATPQTIAEAERTADKLIEALRKKNQNRPDIQELHGSSGYGRRPQYHPHGSTLPQTGYIGSSPPDIFAPYGYGNSYDIGSMDRYGAYHPNFETHGLHYPIADPYSNYQHRIGYSHRRTYSHPYLHRQVMEQNIETGLPNESHQYPGLESHHLYHQRPHVSAYSHHYRHNQVGPQNVESVSNIEQFNGNHEPLVKVQHRPVYSGIKGRRIVHPMMQEPVQTPLQDPIIAYGRAPSSAKNSESRPEKNTASEHVEVQEPKQESLGDPIVGYGRTLSSTKNYESRPVKVTLSTTEVAPVTPPEDLSWWQKSVNKAKQVAQNLKQKLGG